MNSNISPTKRTNWANLAPSEHLVQIYNSRDSFLDTLEGFVTGGLNKGESVVLIATPEHVDALSRRTRAALSRRTPKVRFAKSAPRIPASSTESCPLPA